jgi:hypothetical protein
VLEPLGQLVANRYRVTERLGEGGMLGTNPADKRHFYFDTPHDVQQRRPELVREVLGWLDKYLGRVN